MKIKSTFTRAFLTIYCITEIGIRASFWHAWSSALNRLELTISTQSCAVRSSPPEVLLGKVVVKICCKFTGEHPCSRVISIQLLCNFTEITLRHGSSPVCLLHIFTTPFYMNTFGGLLLLQLQTDLSYLQEPITSCVLFSFHM